MVRASVCGAAALLAQSEDDPRASAAGHSPGGTTEAALKVLIPSLDLLVSEAWVAAARSRELGG